jgi:zinc transporter ZupT
VVLFTASGLPFSHKVDVAAATPQFSAAGLLTFSMLGIYVGVVPVALGMLWLPFLRQLGRRGYAFLLSLTVGLLVFLGVDALHDAFETGAELPGPFQGVALILISLSLSLFGLYVLTRWVEQRQAQIGGQASLVLAYLVAFSIGVHNLGEGLAIGGAYALGKIATGALLIIGFMIHNLTEGIAVVAPIVSVRMGGREGGVSWWHLAGLGALAGLPTVLGSSMGAFAPSPVFAVVFLAVGAGAVFQVVVEIVAQMKRGVEGGALARNAALLSPASLGGFLSGLAVMYLTGLFLAV